MNQPESRVRLKRCNRRRKRNIRLFPGQGLLKDSLFVVSVCQNIGKAVAEQCDKQKNVAIETIEIAHEGLNILS